MSFKEQLNLLSHNYKSRKLNYIKTALKEAALDGRRSATFNCTLYDESVINWLKAQGLTVKETLDQRDGDFITVSWE